MMFCPNCGSPFPDGDMFCSKCGYSLNGVNSLTTDTNSDECSTNDIDIIKNTKPVKDRVKMKKFVKWMSIIACVIAIISAFLPFYSTESWGSSITVNYLQGDGMLMIFLSIITIILTIFQLYKAILFPAIISVALVFREITRWNLRKIGTAVTFKSAYSIMDWICGQIGISSLGDSDKAEIYKSFGGEASLQYGIYICLTATLVIVIMGVLAWAFDLSKKKK